MTTPTALVRQLNRLHDVGLQLQKVGAENDLTPPLPSSYVGWSWVEAAGTVVRREVDSLAVHLVKLGLVSPDDWVVPNVDDEDEDE